MFEIAKTIPEFFNDFARKGMVLDAPCNFQVLPIEYGHGAHIELLYFFDRYRADAAQIPAAMRQKALETDIRHGNFATPPPWGAAQMEKSGPLYSNYNIWAAKLKEAFEPKTD
jgi:hypothetical protein